MSKLYFYNYNNYYNRIVKKEANLLAYGTPTYTLDNANFYEADGCDTKHTINIRATDLDIFNANYLLVLDNNYNIKSRWFVTEVEHSRNRQYILSLRRDLLVDFYDSVINDSPVLIEKALVDKNNPLIFNSEGFEFNQIKKNEIFLKDKLELQWIYLYAIKGSLDSTSIIDVVSNNNQYADYTIGSLISNSIFSAGQKLSKPYNMEYNIWFDEVYTTFKQTASIGPSQTINDRFRGYIEFDLNSSNGVFKSSVNSSLEMYSSSDRLDLGTYSSLDSQDTSTHGYFKNNDKLCNKVAKLIYETFLESNITTINTALKSQSEFSSCLSEADETLLKSMNNKTVKDSSGKIYRVFVSQQTSSHNMSGNKNKAYAQSIESFISSKITYNSNNSTYGVDYKQKTYTVTISEEEALNFQFSLSNDRAITNTSDYDVIAIPYGSLILWIDPEAEPPSYTNLNGDRDFCIAVARSIAQTFTNSKIIDMQILPYGPYNDNIVNSGIDSSTLGSSSYQVVTDNNTHKSTALFYLTNVNYTFDISQTLTVENYVEDEDLNVKLSNECDKYRLVSPNYNSFFEFSVAKNNGVTKFNVDMTLRPYNPYIHINPDFKGLYGEDYNDSRGLILNGDFSLPIINDQWKQYELQNKNYQNIFDRQIQHMDKEFKLSRIEAGFGAITGAIQGGIGGTVAGAGIGGNTASAVTGGLTGGIASALGGAMDYTFLKKRQNENKDLAIDMFNYNLGNIKALPYSLSKNNPFSYNYKEFPFIEYYSCTDEEKDILLEKIKYNSMTVMSIGYISDYLREDKQFIKGTLIRYEGAEAINDHEIYEIYNELKKGVYI